MIIPFFLMNRGCPHHCLFCNEKLTAGGYPERITDAAFAETVRAYLAGAGQKGDPIEIAFYGGTFTGMELEEQRRLLALASDFLREGKIDGIRISTRPDEIDAARLDLLRSFGVSTVELGVQSLDDEVLLASKRGHTTTDAVEALRLLKEKGFKTGFHLMAGLPGDSPVRFGRTIEKTIALRPDTVRIHPTLVLRDTPLAEAFRRGEYFPLGLDEAIDLAKQALRALRAAGIPVIRLGLQATKELEEPGAIVAGPYHPAFRSLVETALFLETASALIAAAGLDSGAALPTETGGEAAICFTLSPADISDFCGRGRENIVLLKGRFDLGDIRIASDQALPRHTLVLTAGDRRLHADPLGQIREIPADPFAG